MNCRRGIVMGLAVVLLTPFFPARGQEIDEIVKLVTEGAADDAERAAKLNAAAEELADEPAIRKKLYLKAYEYGMKSTEGLQEAGRAVKALDAGGSLEKGALADMRLDVLEKQYTLTRGQKQRAAGEELVTLLTDCGDSLVASGKSSDARDLYQRALVIAGAIGNGSTAGKLRDKIQLCQERMTLEKKVADLEARLEKNPKDTKIREELITYCLVELDNPEQAAGYLADDTDLELATYVRMAAEDISSLESAECVELGAWYEKMGRGKPRQIRIATLLKARSYYARAAEAEGKSSVTKLKAKLAMKEVEKDLDGLGYVPPDRVRKGAWVDLTKYFDPDSPRNVGKIEARGKVIALMGGGGEYNSGSWVIPIELDGEYLLRLQVQLSARLGYAYIDLPCGPDHRTYLGIRYSEMGIHGIGDHSWATSLNPTNTRVDLDPKVPYLFEIWVKPSTDRVGIVVGINGKKHISWQGKLAGLRTAVSPNVLGLRSYRHPAAYGSPSLKVVSGNARVLDFTSDSTNEKKAAPPAAVPDDAPAKAPAETESAPETDADKKPAGDAAAEEKHGSESETTEEKEESGSGEKADDDSGLPFLPSMESSEGAGESSAEEEERPGE